MQQIQQKNQKILQDNEQDILLALESLKIIAQKLNFQIKEEEKCQNNRESIMTNVISEKGKMDLH
jgi:hypothetical protein